jgi:hypothetical protein
MFLFIGFSGPVSKAGLEIKRGFPHALIQVQVQVQLKQQHSALFQSAAFCFMGQIKAECVLMLYT